ncbi:MAG: sulfite exporter TauE/SafE family protein [Ruminococcaceae bacterium]|nr:sulfite exporter TauE/SafE family protein [Oscillospiraceae bacterium]
MDLIQIVWLAVITVIGSYIQSVSGFGFGIFAMLFLPNLLLFTEANMLSSILSLLTSATVVLATFRQIHWKNITFPALGCIAASLFAVAFVKSQKNETMVLLLGIAMCLLSLYFFFFSGKIKIKPTWYAGLIAGVLSGIMGGLFSTGGPPAVIYFLQSEEDSDRYLPTISAYFVLTNFSLIVTKAVAGFITVNVWLGLAVGVVGMIVGSLIGKSTREKIKPAVLKKIVYAVMACGGIVNILKVLM